MWLALLREILCKTYIVIVYWPGCDVRYIETKFIFVIKLFFVHDKKNQDKNLNILRTKRALR